VLATAGHGLYGIVHLALYVFDEGAYLLSRVRGPFGQATDLLCHHAEGLAVLSPAGWIRRGWRVTIASGRG